MIRSRNVERKEYKKMNVNNDRKKLAEMKRRIAIKTNNKRKAMVLALSAVLLLFASTASFADYNRDNNYSQVEALVAVEEESDASAERLAIDESDNIEIESDNEIIEIDENLETIDIDIYQENGEPFSISIYNEEDANSDIVDNALVSYDEEKDFAEVTEFFDGGLRRSFYISDMDAPEEYPLDFEIPNGYYFRFAADDETGETDGSIELVNTNEEPVIALSLPWAVDAFGKDVDTEYEINDDSIIQKVYHKGGDYQYPIVADPSAQYNNWFSGTSWKKNKSGWTLSVKPSKALKNKLFKGNKKTQNTAAAVNTSWNVLYKQHKGSSHWKKTQGLKDQYKCHVYFATNKSRWNLDTWRPSVGYAKTVRKACNP